MLSTTITFVFAMFILIRLPSTYCSCNICCSSCGVSVHRNMSSAKRRWERNYPSIFRSLFSQFTLLNMLSKVAVNSLDEIVSPCLIPLLILIFSLSLCRCTVTEPPCVCRRCASREKFRRNNDTLYLPTTST